MSIQCTIAAGGVIYVDAMKNGDGSSWTNAYMYLQDTLSAAGIRSLKLVNVDFYNNGEDFGFWAKDTLKLVSHKNTKNEQDNFIWKQTYGTIPNRKDDFRVEIFD